jgi:hypothetical protein
VCDTTLIFHTSTLKQILRVWLAFLQVDNIYVIFRDQVFQQSVGIPMGTNCAPLSVDLFLYPYEEEFVKKNITG